VTNESAPSYAQARDLARYGLLFARLGMGVLGQATGNAAWLAATMSGRGTRREYGLEEGLEARYSNQTMVTGIGLADGPVVGHGGFGGQYLMADPTSGAAISFFSVLETEDASDITGGGTYNGEVVAMELEIVQMLREGLNEDYAMDVNKPKTAT
jgi:CubicO group peptidase (beta-lactamase class C family)